MILARLSISNFRNYDQYSIAFPQQITIIEGPNTAGKTSILEAVNLLSTGSSFRAEREREMIRHANDVAHVLADLSDKTKLHIVLTTGMVSGKKTPYKITKINDISKRVNALVGRLPTVLFWPEDLDLVTGSPSRRRTYLDHVLIQAIAEYRTALRLYEKAVRVRNKLLKYMREGTPIPPDELLYWEEQLIQHGTLLQAERRKYIAYVNACSQQSTPEDMRFTLEYDQSIISRERLDSYHDAERASGVTLVGPHRDDIFIYKGDVPRETEQLSKFGSRGEQRMGVLWLKRAELQFLEEKTNTSPLLLLDDILSELDIDHRRAVFESIGSHQTIITTADQNTVIPELGKTAKVVTLRLLQ